MGDRNEPFVDHPAKRPDGLFLIGSADSGIEALGGALQSMSAGMVSKQIAVPGLRELADLNDLLLSELGASLDDPPSVAMTEILPALGGWTDECREAFREVFGTPGTEERGLPPWIWADPRLSFLAPYWAAVLDVSPAAVFVHRRVDYAVVSSFGAPSSEFEGALQRWSRLTRACLNVVDSMPSTVVQFEELTSESGSGLGRIKKFLAAQRVAIDDTDHLDFPAGSLPLGHDAEIVGSRTVPHQLAVLDELVQCYEQAQPSASVQGRSPAAITLAASGFFDRDYYTSDYGEFPYRSGEDHWIHFFGRIGERIANELAPARVLDIGCGIGFLVAALRDRGIDASGIDASDWAVSHAISSDACRHANAAVELEGDYDLITCIEVLQELPRFLAAFTVANLCRHAEAVLFAATPDDFEKATHLNVETAAYWSRLFADNGFLRDFAFDATFVAPHAVLYRRQSAEPSDIVTGYERSLEAERTQVKRAHHDVVELREQLRGTIADLERKLQDQAAVAQRDLAELQARRTAESVAGADALLESERHQLQLARSLRRIEEERDRARAHVEGILQTRFYKYTTRLRKFYFLARTAKKVPELVVHPDQVVPDDPSYASWVRVFDTLDDEARKRIADRVAALVDPPVISILLPVYESNHQYLTEAIESVRSQIYPHWELCIVDDCSPDASLSQWMSTLADGDSRIKFLRRAENGHISAATNTALDLASGELIACLDHDDKLTEHALAMFALEIAENPHLQMIYSDEDKISEQGERHDPFFKPEFDPLLLMGQNYLCHLSMYRRSLIEAVGGFRVGFEGSQDWDLALRATERLSAEEIGHIPRILYHWRVHPGSTASSLSAKTYAGDAGQLAVREHLDRTGAAGEVISTPFTGWNRVKWSVPDPVPLVSIVIPTRDGKLLSRCLSSIRDRTTYPRFEVVVVDNGSLSHQTLTYLRSNDSWIEVIRDESPFNYPAINNRAVARANGDVVCLLNDDTEVLSGDWLEEMVGQLSQPSVGAVGAKLYYSNGQVQHAGVVLGIGGVAGHIHRLADRQSFADHGRLRLPRAYSAVTAACMAVRREAWVQVGGMDESNLPVAFNDIDFCLRLEEMGWRVVWTPYAELTHHESISRGPDTEGDSAIRFEGETRYMKQRWGALLRNDPAYNPNLTLVDEQAGVAWPPRVSSL